MDVNVVIAALISPHGSTTQFLTDYMEEFDVYVPDVGWKELKKHFETVVMRKSKDPTAMWSLLSLLVEDVHLVPSLRFEEFLSEALRFVFDESDAPYVALALYLRGTYPRACILTYNVADFDVDGLKGRNVYVLTPGQLKFLNSGR